MPLQGDKRPRALTGPPSVINWLQCENSWQSIPGEAGEQRLGWGRGSLAGGGRPARGRPGGGDVCARPVLRGASPALAPPARPAFVRLPPCFPAAPPLPSGVCRSTLGLCVQLGASPPVCGCGVCGCVTGECLPSGLGLGAWGLGGPAPPRIPAASLPSGHVPQALSALGQGSLQGDVLSGFLGWGT